MKNPSAYSWEGDNYSRGYSPHLTGWTEQTGECVRSLSKASSEVTTGNRTHGLRVEGPKGSEQTGECARSLSKASSEVTTGNRTHGLIVEGPKGSDYTGGPARSLSRVSSEVTTGNRRRVSCGVQPLV